MKLLGSAAGEWVGFRVYSSHLRTLKKRGVNTALVSIALVYSDSVARVSLCYCPFTPVYTYTGG
jgi:hypothetical protein